MFRLDYLDANGAVLAPVLGHEVGILQPDRATRPVKTQHATTARKHARAAAEQAQHAVLISRVIGEDVKPTTTVQPDGRSGRPPGFKPASTREDCTQGSGQRCFCTACRAERKARR